jgi:hypothetical protein
MEITLPLRKIASQSQLILVTVQVVNQQEVRGHVKCTAVNVVRALLYMINNNIQAS